MTERSIFLAALEIDDPAARADYLDRACVNDPALRSQVERLLQAHAQPGAFMERPALTLVATVDAPPVSERPGTVLGPYKLMEQIGEGGMGLVFVAEQQQPVRRKVALKVIKPGMDSRQVIARFEAERQALALMDHPNIAQVHDGGATPAGRPYFVMELVKGVPITDYCDQERLTARERLGLFLSVCQAVQHAHQRGIIHRDLKPSNVLVTSHDGTPVVKVIDFGIAKAVGQQLTEKTVYTAFTQLIGSPLYMSPEQAGQSSLDVDTRTDIYALGVLLYELLTGTTPFAQDRLRQADSDEVRRIIREEEPPKPSTRVNTLGQAATTVSTRRKTDPRRLTELCRGELDWIVMKALEKDRNRRYESAAALAADLQRYLKDEPVQACPPSAWYRFRKFARRHRTGVITAASLAVGSVLAVGGLASALLVQAASNAEIRHEQTQTRAALEREKQTSEARNQALGREERASYFRSIALAEGELAAEHVGRAEELLDACPPHLRGWEWHYLKRRPYGPLVLRERSGRTTAVAISPDGKFVAAAGPPLDITVWERATGKEVRQFRGQPAVRLAFSPDGQRLASAGWDGTVRVWDVTTGTDLGQMKGHSEYVTNVAFRPDGRQLASASWDGSAILWDAATLRPLRKLLGHAKGLNGIAFSPDGNRLATASTDATVRVWDTATGQTRHTLRGHTAAVMGVAFSRDGRRLASAGFDGNVRLWDAVTGEAEATLRADIAYLTGVALSPDGTRLATGGLERVIHVWDLESQQEALTLRGHAGNVNDLTFSADGRQLVSAGGGTVRIWDASPAAEKAEEVRTLSGHRGAALGVAFHPDGRRLASAGGDETIRLWDAITGAELATLSAPSGPAVGPAFSGDGRLLAAGSFGAAVRLWDVETRRERHTFPGFAGTVALSRDGRRLASATEVGFVHVWDTATGREALPAFRGHLSSVIGLAFSPDGTRLATTSMDGTAKVWDAATGRPVFPLTSHTSNIQCVTFDAAGKRLATASWDTTARVWDAATGKELLALRGHNDRVLGVAFSPDGKRLATASWDNTAKVWDAATGRPLATLRGHSGYVFGVAFSPDGKRLATAGGYRGKGEVKIWDATRWDK